MAKVQTQTLNQQFLNSYRRQLDAQGETAAAYFAKSIDAYSRANPNASTAEFRDFTIDLFGVALPNFTDLSATLSCELFDTLAESVGFEGERARTYDDTDYEMVNEKVRYMARHLNDDDVAAFKREVTDITKYYVKRSAFENMRRNCESQKVKWARVPSGFETCGFCFMLASRGFVYSSERTARDGRHGYHRNCDCIAIPGFQKNGNPLVKIDGYDPEGMAERWISCARTAGIRKQGDVVTGNWTQEELDAVIREVETRNSHWLYTGRGPITDRKTIFATGIYDGTPSSVSQIADALDSIQKKVWHEYSISGDYQSTFGEHLFSYSGNGNISAQHGAHPEGKEIQLASWLSGAGHDIEFIKPYGAKGSHTPDMRIDGEPWEVKRMTTGNRTKIKVRLSEGANQAENLVLDLSVNEKNLDALEEAAIEMLADKRVSKLMVVRDGNAYLYEK